jgi:hypothetical protein
MRGLLLVVLMATVAAGADVEWTRFKGKVKNVNQKASTLTIQNGEGDLITVKITGDVQIIDGKEFVPIGQVAMDQKVTLVYAPKPPTPKEDEAEGSVYPPIKR